MIVPNTERKYEEFVIGLCIHKDDDGEFYEAYYRKNGEVEIFTENNFWPNPKSAYEGVIKQLQQFLSAS